jgi:hypothetical protein
MHRLLPDALGDPHQHFGCGRVDPLDIFQDDCPGFASDGEEEVRQKGDQFRPAFARHLMTIDGLDLDGDKVGQKACLAATRQIESFQKFGDGLSAVSAGLDRAEEAQDIAAHRVKRVGRMIGRALQDGEMRPDACGRKLALPRQA